MNIHETILTVMRSVGVIAKGQKNTFDKYMFRGIDDLYNVLGPAFAEYGLYVTPTVTACDLDTFTTTKGAVQQRAVVTVSYTLHAEDGTEVTGTVVGEGADRGDKAVNMAMTSAFKTFMFQTLCIPTEEQSDSEFSSPEHDAGEAAPPSEPPPALGPAFYSKVESFTREACTKVGRDPEEWTAVLVDSMRSLGAAAPSGAPADGSNWKGILAAQLAEDAAFTSRLKVQIQMEVER